MSSFPISMWQQYDPLFAVALLPSIIFSENSDTFNACWGGLFWCFHIPPNSGVGYFGVFIFHRTLGWVILVFSYSTELWGGLFWCFHIPPNSGVGYFGVFIFHRTLAWSTAGPLTSICLQLGNATTTTTTTPTTTTTTQETGTQSSIITGWLRSACAATTLWGYDLLSGSPAIRPKKRLQEADEEEAENHPYFHRSHRPAVHSFPLSLPPVPSICVGNNCK